MRMLPLIFEHELENLLHALRRDVRSERERAKIYPTDREWHEQNARNCVRLLEALNPRKPERQLHESMQKDTS